MYLHWNPKMTNPTQELEAAIDFFDHGNIVENDKIIRPLWQAARNYAALLPYLEQQRKIKELASKVVSYYQFGGIKGNPDSLAAIGDLALALSEESKEVAEINKILKGSE